MIQNIEERINKRIKNNSKKFIVLKRIVYIICFTSLCLIDQVIGSATGYIQYGLKYYTAFIIAIIIMSAYRLKDFMKIPYFIWVLFFFALRTFILEWGESNSGNFLELQTKLWCIGIYGIICIRIFYILMIEKARPQIKWPMFILSAVMLFSMAIIRSDWTWPKVLFVSMFCFYLTNFKDEDLNNLYAGMIDGIILGFFIIQIQAWMYRPYDVLRYLGMYSHPNMNAFFYVCAYCAILCKWYFLKLKKKHGIFRVLCVLLAGLVIDTMLFTGSRTALSVAIFVTLLFISFQFSLRKRMKLVELLIELLVLSVACIICFMPAYAMLRYIPAYIDEPIYFEGEIAKKKINKGDKIDSPKYSEIDEALEGNISRYLWFMDEEEASKVEQQLIQWVEKMLSPMQVQASELVDGYYWYSTDEVYIEPGTDSKHPLLKIGEEYTPIEQRLEIYKYFWNKLALLGNKKNPQGVWLNTDYQATHCHNIFLQMAYDFGIIVGIMFIIVTLMLFNRIIFGLTENKSSMWYYRLFITASFATIEVVFGMTEMAYIYGQLPLTMFWLVQYIVYHKQPHEIEAEQASGDGNDRLFLAKTSVVVLEDGLEIIDMDKE